MNGVYSKNGSKWLDACSVDFRCIRFTSNLAQTFLRCISPRHKRKLEDIIHIEGDIGKWLIDWCGSLSGERL